MSSIPPEPATPTNAKKLGCFGKLVWLGLRGILLLVVVTVLFVGWIYISGSIALRREIAWIKARQEPTTVAELNAFYAPILGRTDVTAELMECIAAAGKLRKEELELLRAFASAQFTDRALTEAPARQILVTQTSLVSQVCKLTHENGTARFAGDVAADQMPYAELRNLQVILSAELAARATAI